MRIRFRYPDGRVHVVFKIINKSKKDFMDLNVRKLYYTVSYSKKEAFRLRDFLNKHLKTKAIDYVQE